MLLAEHALEIRERRVVGPELAAERGLLRRDREQEQVVDRQHRPQQHRDADEQQLGFVGDLAACQLHLAADGFPRFQELVRFLIEALEEFFFGLDHHHVIAR